MSVSVGFPPGWRRAVWKVCREPQQTLIDDLLGKTVPIPGIGALPLGV